MGCSGSLMAQILHDLKRQMGTEKDRCRDWTTVTDCMLLLNVAQSLLLAAFVVDSEILSYVQSHGKPQLNVPHDQFRALDFGKRRGAAENLAMAHPTAALGVHTIVARHVQIAHFSESFRSVKFRAQ